MSSWLAHLVAPLNVVLFHLGNDAVSWAELLGFLTGAACVWLTVRSSIHNFWIGILNSALFLVLFASARFWADSGLQILFIVLGFTGWWQWLRGSAGSALVVGRAGVRTVAGCLVFAVLATWGLAVLLRHVHDVAPFWDALTTSLSLAAQYLLNAKKVQTWWFWIAADLIYVPLYTVKRLDLTAIVYVLFLAMAVMGLRSWRAALQPAAIVPETELVPA